MLKTTSVLANIQQYGHDICVTWYARLHTNVRKFSQNTYQKMRHPVCEIWLARKRGSSQPLTILHHPILLLITTPYSCKQTPVEICHAVKYKLLFILEHWQVSFCI